MIFLRDRDHDYFEEKFQLRRISLHVYEKKWGIPVAYLSIIKESHISRIELRNIVISDSSYNDLQIYIYI